MTLKREKKPFDHKAEFFLVGGGGAGRGARLTQALAFFDQKHGVAPLEK